MKRILITLSFATSFLVNLNAQNPQEKEQNELPPNQAPKEKLEPQTLSQKKYLAHVDNYSKAVLKSAKPDGKGAHKAFADYYTKNRTDIQLQIKNIIAEWDAIKEQSEREKSIDIYSELLISNEDLKQAVTLRRQEQKNYNDGKDFLKAQSILKEQLVADLTPFRTYILSKGLPVEEEKEPTTKAEICIHNIKQVQKAIRSVQNLNNLKPTDPLTWEMILGNKTQYALKMPKCPLGGTYTLSQTIPAIGTPACTCSLSEYAPKDTKGW